MASSGETSESSNLLLQPGEQIRPQTTHEDVINFAKRLYNFSNITITEFKAYDDRNYHIRVNDVTDKAVWPHGYMMKVINTLDSKKLAFMEAQQEMMLYLGSHGIVCPQPVKNTLGQYFSVEKLYRKDDGSLFNEHLVKLLTFQPGTILHQVPCTNSVFFQTGQYIANIDRLLKGFHHPAFKDHKTLWMLESVPMLRQFQYAVTDEKRHQMITEILDSFDALVIPEIPNLEQGMLHGDFNEQNILASEGANGWEISGVIDFGDTQYSCYVFELAITICYMMLIAKEQDPLDVGGHVIAGYSTVRVLPEKEFNLLKLCVSARFCQSLVMSSYSHLQDPENEYVLTTQAAGWQILTSLHATSKQQLEERWKKIQHSY